MAEQPTCGRRQQRQQSGFSLVELMTVVIIIGVLSAVAIPTFTSYVYKARTAEATEFLGVIKLREESYRSEFGMYCETLGNSMTAFSTAANLVPSSGGRDPVAFSSGPATPLAKFDMLGAHPSGAVRFGYGVAAGPPTTLPDDGSGGNFGYTAATADYWFIAQAQGDLDGDGNRVTFETYSASRTIWIGGQDHAGEKGWE